MKFRNVASATLTLASFGLLVPGLIRPLITISATLRMSGAEMPLFTETRSILQSIRSLHESGNDFVAGLILLFSVIVPFIKGALLAYVAAGRDARRRYGVFRFVRSVSKWAMADVFLVGVYVAYLSAKATDNLDATIGSGFYFFAAYCLVSLAALQFLSVAQPPGEANA